MKPITVQVETISPEIAKKWLEKGGTNRRLTESNVNFLYNQMRTGNWFLSGDTIKFGEDGTLLDGQHRLTAIVKYAKPIETFVARGLKPEVFQVLDTGKSRSAADALSATGYKYSTNLAAISRNILLFQQGHYTASGGNKRLKASNKDVLDFVRSHEEIQEICAFVQNHIYQNFRFITLAHLGTIYYILSRKNQTKADEFFGKYANGIDLSETNPIRHLRERLIKDKVNKLKLTGRDKIALVIYTWNNFILNKRVSQLTLPKNYEMPKPV